MWPELFLILTLIELEGKLFGFEQNGLFIYYSDIYLLLSLQASQIRKYK